MAVILPVIPSAALKFGAANAIAAAGVATAAAGGGSAAGTAGPLAALAGKLGISAAAVKGTAATVAVTVAAGGGAVAVKEVREPAGDARSAPIERSSDGGAPVGGAQGPRGAGGSAVVPGLISEGDNRLRRESAGACGGSDSSRTTNVASRAPRGRPATNRQLAPQRNVHDGGPSARQARSGAWSLVSAGDRSGPRNRGSDGRRSARARSGSRRGPQRSHRSAPLRWSPRPASKSR